MKRLIIAVALVLATFSAMAADLVTVRIGIHANEGGAPLAARALKKPAPKTATNTGTFSCSQRTWKATITFLS